MTRTIIQISIFALFLSALASVAPAAAQDSTRVYDQGSVWNVSYVRTKPSQFNAYLNDLSKVWRVFLEEQKKDGDILSYKILAVTSPRDGEANLILMIESKNYATYDRGPEYFEELSAKVMGSLEDSRQANIDRGALRDLMGGFDARELKFTN